MSEHTDPFLDGQWAQRCVRQARVEVLGGRGPGASQGEVFRHGRGKLVQAGRPVVRRLAETARDAAHARAPGLGYTDGGLVAVASSPTVAASGTHGTPTAEKTASLRRAVENRGVGRGLAAVLMGVFAVVVWLSLRSHVGER